VSDGSYVMPFVVSDPSQFEAQATFTGNDSLWPASAKSNTPECVFDWAERSYAQYFSPAGASSQLSDPYYFRYYPGTKNYLAVSAANDHIWVLGPMSGDSPLDVSPLSYFANLAGCSN
jgi:hypothetical protein